MGVFSGKEKVPAESIVKLFVDTWILTGTSKERLRELFGDVVSDDSDKQYLELMAVHMFAVVYSIQRGVQNDVLRKKMIDLFHASVYQQAIFNNRQRSALKSIINERYSTYSAIMHQGPGTNASGCFGKAFNDNFCERPDILVTMYPTEKVIKGMIANTEMLKDLQRKCELV
jgi:hypothetical protein